jgi:hypothetical protein
MNEHKTAIEIGDLTGLKAPACKLIEKVSEAVGGVFQPWQTRRVADAEADALLKKGIAEIQLEGMQRRAMQRWFDEETRKQANIESITEKAIPLLNDDSDASKIEDDWVTNFFERSRNVSDEDMQQVWAKILATEANGETYFSKKTINILEDIDSIQASRFQILCSLELTYYYESYALDSMETHTTKTREIVLFETRSMASDSAPIKYDELRNFASLGLITIEPENLIESTGPKVDVEYYHEKASIPVMPFKGLNMGSISLTRWGRELSRVFDKHYVDGYWDYLLTYWSLNNEAARWVVEEARKSKQPPSSDD